MSRSASVAPFDPTRTAPKDAATENGFGIIKSGLAEIILEKDVNVLSRFGGAKGVMRKLKTDPEKGLRSEAVELHRTVYGRNVIPGKDLEPLWKHYFEALNDVVLIALIIASVVLLGYGAMYSSGPDLLQGLGIMIAVFIVSFCGALMGYQQEKGMQQLALIMSDREVNVVRDGEERTISVLDLVVGDIMVLREGEILPVDGLYVSGSGLRVNESTATGEDVIIGKGPDALFFIGASKITGGMGRMLVMSVGLESTYGQIVKTMEDIDDLPTILSTKLVTLATRIGYVGLSSGVLVFLALTIAYLIKFYPLYDNAFRSILNYFIMGLTVIVVAVPEGLPLSLVLTHVTAMKTLLKDKVLVKKVETMEMLGEVTAVVGHKSGLLTHNIMNVTRGWFYGAMADGVPDLAKTVGGVRRDLIARCIALNTDASIRYTAEAFKVFRGLRNPSVTVLSPAAQDAADMHQTEAMRACDLIGQRTEVALLHMLRVNLDVDYAYVRKTAGEFVYRENFNAVRRKVSTIYGPDSPGSSTAPLLTVEEGGKEGGAVSAMAFPGAGKFVVYTTGGPEAVCGACAVYMNADGALVPMDGRRRETINGMVDLLASRGLRPIALAVKAIDPSNAPAGYDSPDPHIVSKAWASACAAGSVESGLTLIGILGLRDPLHTGIGACVAQCREGGIKVRLATGEHPMTAKTLAEQAGILTDGLCIDGATWRAMSPDERTAIVPRLEVLCRAMPSDKLALVKALQEVGEVVVATGDDPVTIGAADIGAAMGDWASEMSKEQARLMVLDGAFTTLVKTLIWGRCIIENVRRFLTFQLTINSVAVTLTLIVAVTHMGADVPFPLESIQLLWVNLIMDSFGALMLATEEPDPELLQMTPGDKRQPLFTRTMLKQVGLSSLMQLLMLLGLLLTHIGGSIYGFTPEQVGSRAHCTCVYNTFIFLQVFNFFNTRRIHDQMDLHRGLGRAATGLGIMGGIVVLQLVWVMLGGNALKTVALPFSQLAISIVLGAVSILIGGAARLIPYRDKNFKGAGKLSAAVLPLPPSLVQSMRAGAMRSTLNFSAMSPRDTAGGTARSGASSMSASGRSNAARQTDRAPLMSDRDSAPLS